MWGTQIYSGEAMASSLSLRGRRAGGDPDPLLSSSPSALPSASAAQPPQRKGITPPTRKKTGISQTQRSSFSLLPPPSSSEC